MTEVACSRFDCLLSDASLQPSICELCRRGDAVRLDALAKLFKVSDLTPWQQDQVEAATRRIVTQLLDAPVAELRQAHRDSGRANAADLFRRLFRLGQPAT